MKNLLLLLLLTVFYPQQPAKWGTTVCMRADGNNQFYVLGKNLLIRYAPNGEENARYSDFRQGSFSQLDVSNPMKILLFHEDMQRISMLDRSLNLIRVIQLADRGILQAGSVCLAANGDVWVLDIADMRLKRIREMGAPVVLSESQPITRIPGISCDPLQMLEYNGAVYVADKTEGILLFDQLANFKRRIPYHGVKSIQVFKQKLYAFTGNSLIRFGENQFAPDSLPVYPSDHYAITENRSLRIVEDSLLFSSFP